MLSKIKLFHNETKTLVAFFILFLEWIVELSGGGMKCGGVTFLLSNGLCACDLLHCKVLRLICHTVNKVEMATKGNIFGVLSNF